MYQILGWIGTNLVSVHYSSDKDYVDSVRKLGSIRLRDGRILDLDVNRVGNAPVNTYVQWIKDCAKYGVFDCNDVPEFE